MVLKYNIEGQIFLRGVFKDYCGEYNFPFKELHP
jgi:hypothetical protein